MMIDLDVANRLARDHDFEVTDHPGSRVDVRQVRDTHLFCKFPGLSMHGRVPRYVRDARNVPDRFKKNDRLPGSGRRVERHFATLGEFRTKERDGFALFWIKRYQESPPCDAPEAWCR